MSIIFKSKPAHETGPKKEAIAQPMSEDDAREFYEDFLKDYKMIQDGVWGGGELF